MPLCVSKFQVKVSHYCSQILTSHESSPPTASRCTALCTRVAVKQQEGRKSPELHSHSCKAGGGEEVQRCCCCQFLASTAIKRQVTQLVIARLELSAAGTALQAVTGAASSLMLIEDGTQQLANVVKGELMGLSRNPHWSSQPVR